MSYTIPIGPFHPSLEEPFKLELVCDGETIREVGMSIKFNFRGIEWLAEQKNYSQAIALLERVCGICSHLHGMTFCRSLEKIAEVEVPPRAGYIRVIFAELERIVSHVLWAGLAAEVLGFQTLFMTCFALREKGMDLLESLSGSRVNYGISCIGGANRDIEHPETLLAAIDEIRVAIGKTLIPLFTNDRTIRARCAGVGVMTGEQARELGTVGPTARASGVSQDIRTAAPYEVYDRLDFDVPVETSGDVLARVVVRLLETLESCRIIRQAIEEMPSGPIRGASFVEIPAGETVCRSEAPRGECFYYVASDGSETPLRVKVRTPSYVNIPAVRVMLKNAPLADAALVQASVDPCYSCTSR